jgi:hypothetical protein
MAPPPWSFAADANDCIIGWDIDDPPNKFVGNNARLPV